MNADKDDKGRDTRPRRMIYLQMWLSQEFAELDTFGRLLWIGVITAADDHGRLRADPRLVRAKLFPRDDPPPSTEDIGSRLEQMARLGLLHLYEVDGEHYAEIINWTEFQHLKRPRKTFIPPPPDEMYPSVPSCTLANLDDPSCTLGVQNGGTGIGIGKEKEPEPEVGTEGAVTEKKSGGPGGSESDQARPGPLCYMDGETHYVQRAWREILAVTSKWGAVTEHTLRALQERTIAAPEYALAFVLDTDENKKVHTPWGALSHALKQKAWCPKDANLQRAKNLIRGSPKPRNGVGTIGEVLKEMEEKA